MLIHCPRCGFSQPQDRYCAQCGVDIQTYRPQSVPIWKKVVNHPTFQIAFVLGIAAYISLHFIQRSMYDPGNPRRPYSFLRILSPEITPSSHKENSKLEPQDQSEVNENINNDLPSEEIQDGQANTFEGQNQSGNNNLEKSTASNSLNSSNASGNYENNHSPIRVTFYEVDRQILTQFFNESQNNGMFSSTNDLSIGLISNIDKKLSPSNPRIKVLHQVSPMVDENKEVSLSYGNAENELLIRIDSIDTRENNLKGHIEINRTWKDGPEGEQFEVNTNSGFYISGIIPRKSGLEQDAQLKQGPFQILSSKRFQNRDSEIVMFIEYILEK